MICCPTDGPDIIVGNLDRNEQAAIWQLWNILSFLQKQGRDRFPSDPKRTFNL